MNGTFATAGTHGPDIRSDCRVTAQLRDEGEPVVTIDSRVASLYGNSIMGLARATLETLHATDLALHIEDSGALPFVLQARIEAAVRRLRPGLTSTALPPMLDTVRGDTQGRLQRSRLYLPGNTPKFFVNAGLHQPDAVILDLEDSVAAAEKDAARILVRNALCAVDFRGCDKLVRVNGGPAGLDEIRMLAPLGVDGFLLPKVEDAETVRVAAHLLDQFDARATVIPIIENARGVFAALAIASASPRVSGLTLGLEDYTADIGALRTASGHESYWAQSQIVNAARAVGITPLASVYSAVDDETGFRNWLADARGLGFAGAGCLHPRQIRIVHQAFAPSIADITKAERIVAAFDAAVANGVGAIRVDGQMIDAPIAERARQVLRLAERA